MMKLQMMMKKKMNVEMMMMIANQKLLIGLCSVVPNDILASPSARYGYELFS